MLHHILARQRNLLNNLTHKRSTNATPCAIVIKAKKKRLNHCIPSVVKNLINSKKRIVITGFLDAICVPACGALSFIKRACFSTSDCRNIYVLATFALTSFLNFVIFQKLRNATTAITLAID